MNDAQLIPAVLLLSVITIAVCYAVMRSILRENENGPADEDESRTERRTEERKNARIRKEIERWREGL